MAYKSPFEYTTQKPLVKNYAEIFDPKEYECKDSLELESYGRNLHNYLKTLLEQTPFPAFLFEKLEKRLDGITSILANRSAARGVLDKRAALKRLKDLGERIDSFAPVPIETGTEVEPLAKRQRVDPLYVQEVRKEADSLKTLRQSYSAGSREEEEED